MTAPVSRPHRLLRRAGHAVEYEDHSFGIFSPFRLSKVRRRRADASRYHPPRKAYSYMITDRPPRTPILLAQFSESDRLIALDVPHSDHLRKIAGSIQKAMLSGHRLAVQRGCADFLSEAANFYNVSKPLVRVLAARPIRIREGGWTTELFGDYQIETQLIRVWMRTAIRKQVTSFGTFLSTLCHELCHHLDFEHFGFKDSPHTRGFYERTAILYHNSLGTPRKRLHWRALPDGRWRIDWVRTRTEGLSHQ